MNKKSQSPLCVNCEFHHYVKGETQYQSRQCWHPLFTQVKLRRNVLTGSEWEVLEHPTLPNNTTINRTCEHHRRNGAGLCGVEGRLFKKKLGFWRRLFSRKTDASYKLKEIYPEGVVVIREDY